MSEAVKSRPTIAHRRRLATAAPAIRCSRMLDAAPWTEGSGGKEATPYTCGLLPVTCYWMASSGNEDSCKRYAAGSGQNARRRGLRKLNVADGLRQDEHLRVVVLSVKRADKKSDCVWFKRQRHANQLFAVGEGDGDLATARVNHGSIARHRRRCAVEVPHEENRLELSERHRHAGRGRRIRRRPHLHYPAAGEKVADESFQEPSIPVSHDYAVHRWNRLPARDQAHLFDMRSLFPGRRRGRGRRRPLQPDLPDKGEEVRRCPQILKLPLLESEILRELHHQLRGALIAAERHVEIDRVAVRHRERVGHANGTDWNGTPEPLHEAGDQRVLGCILLDALRHDREQGGKF